MPWDESWQLDKKWSEEISVLNVKESQSKIDKIAFVQSKKRNIYTTLRAFDEQKPQIIDQKSKIRSFIEAVSASSNIISSVSI